MLAFVLIDLATKRQIIWRIAACDTEERYKDGVTGDGLFEEVKEIKKELDKLGITLVSTVCQDGVSGRCVRTRKMVLPSNKMRLKFQSSFKKKYGFCVD